MSRRLASIGLGCPANRPAPRTSAVPEAGTLDSHPGVSATTRWLSLPIHAQVSGAMASTLTATAPW